MAAVIRMTRYRAAGAAGVLCMALVAQDAEGQAVGNASDTVVELCERTFVSPRDERD